METDLTYKADFIGGPLDGSVFEQPFEIENGNKVIPMHMLYPIRHTRKGPPHEEIASYDIKRIYNDSEQMIVLYHYDAIINEMQNRKNANAWHSKSETEQHRISEQLKGKLYV